MKQISCKENADSEGHYSLGFPLFFTMITFVFFVILLPGNLEADDENKHLNSIATPITLNQELQFWEPLLWLTTQNDPKSFQDLSKSMNEHYELLIEVDEFIKKFNDESTRDEALKYASHERLSQFYQNNPAIKRFSEIPVKLNEPLKWYGAFIVFSQIDPNSKIADYNKAIFHSRNSKGIVDWTIVVKSISSIRQEVEKNRKSFLDELNIKNEDAKRKVIDALQHADAGVDEPATLDLLAENAYQYIATQHQGELVSNGIKIIAAFRKKSADIALNELKSNSKLKKKLASFRQDLLDLRKVRGTKSELEQLAHNLSDNEIEDDATLILNYENYFYPGPFLKAGQIDLKKADKYRECIAQWAEKHGKEKLSSLFLTRESQNEISFTHQKILKYKVTERGFKEVPQKLREFLQVAENAGLPSINSLAEGVKNKVEEFHRREFKLSSLTTSIQELRKNVPVGALSVLVQGTQIKLNSSPLHYKVLNIKEGETESDSSNHQVDQSSNFVLDLVCGLGNPQQPFATITVRGLQINQTDNDVKLLTDQSHVMLSSHGQSEQTCSSCTEETGSKYPEIDATKLLENVHPQLATLSRVLGRKWLMKVVPSADSKSLVDSILAGNADLKLSPRLSGHEATTFTIPISDQTDPVKILETQYTKVVPSLTPFSNIPFGRKMTSKWEIQVDQEDIELRTKAISGQLNNIVDSKLLEQILVIIPEEQRSGLRGLEVTSAFIRIQKAQPEVELYGVKYLQGDDEKELILNPEGLVNQARTIANQQAKNVIAEAKERVQEEAKDLLGKKLKAQKMVKRYLDDLKSKLRLKSVEVRSTKEEEDHQLIAELTPGNSKCSGSFILKWPMKNAWPPRNVKLKNKDIAICWAQDYLKSLLKFTDNEIVVINKVKVHSEVLDLDATVNLNQIDPVFGKHKLSLKATIPFTREMTACDIRIVDQQPIGEINTPFNTPYQDQLKINLGIPGYECGILEVPVTLTSSLAGPEWSVSGKLLLVDGKFRFEDADFISGIIKELKHQFAIYITNKLSGVLKKLGLSNEEIINSVVEKIEISPSYNKSVIIPDSLTFTLKGESKLTIQLPSLFGIDELKLTAKIDLKEKTFKPSVIEADSCSFMGNAFEIEKFRAEFPLEGKPLDCSFVSMSVGNIFQITDGSLIIPQDGKGEFGGGGNLSIFGSNLGGVTLRINPNSGSFFIALHLDSGGVTDITGELGYQKSPLGFHLAARGPLFGTGECGFLFDAKLKQPKLFRVGLSYPLTFCIVDGEIRLAETEITYLTVGAKFSKAEVSIQGSNLNTGDPIVDLRVEVKSFGSMTVSIPVNDINEQTILDMIRQLMFPKLNLAFNERFSVGSKSNKPGSKPRNDDGKETPDDENYLKPLYSDVNNDVDLYYTWPEYINNEVEPNEAKLKIHLWHTKQGYFELGDVDYFCTGKKRINHPIHFTSAANNLHLFDDLTEYKTTGKIEYPRIILHGEEANGDKISLILFPHKGRRGSQEINAHLLKDEKITWCAPPEPASAKSEYQYLDKGKYWLLQVQKGEDVINFRIKKAPDSLNDYNSTAALNGIPDKTYIVREKGGEGVSYILLEKRAHFTNISRGWIWLITKGRNGDTRQRLISNPLSKDFGTPQKPSPYILITKIQKFTNENNPEMSESWYFRVQISDPQFPVRSKSQNYSESINPTNAVIFQYLPFPKYEKGDQ